MARKGMGGPGGGMGGMDMNALLKQAQQMQTDMLQAQEALKDEQTEASAGGGMVKVTISGDLVIKDVSIDPDAVDPEDVEMLAEMVQAAVNEAIRSAQKLAESKMPDMPGGMPGMGGPGLPGG
ncbi:MAG: YbaB/EbfC family nucleoid-associated protein [Thermoleophilia bacterium]|nr:YbaB/EbfC family nucleoid-associated protein [Thermoleophilia bacterium]